MFGDDAEALVYTYKNMGINMQALSQPNQAEEYYNAALTIVENLHSQRKSKEHLEELQKGDYT